MQVSEVDFQQSEAPDWVQEEQEDEETTWFFAAASGRYSLCGKLFWSCCKNNEKAQRTCGNETIQNLKTVLVHPKDKQEKEDLTECVYKVPCANCIRSTSAKLEGNLESDYRNTGLKWNPKQDAHLLEAFVHKV